MNCFAMCDSTYTEYTTNYTIQINYEMLVNAYAESKV